MHDEESQRRRRVESAARAAAAWRTVAILSGVGFVMAGSVVVGAGVGIWLDRRWNTEPWLTAFGALLGSAAGFVQMFRLIKLASKKKP